MNAILVYVLLVFNLVIICIQCIEPQRLHSPCNCSCINQINSQKSYVVRLFKNANSTARFEPLLKNNYYCMGIIVNANHVLTSYGCVQNKTVQDIDTSVGPIRQIIKGPEANDLINVALLQLKYSLNLDQNTSAACLSDQSTKNMIMNNVGFTQRFMDMFYVRDLGPKEDRLALVLGDKVICSKNVRFLYSFTPMDKGSPLTLEHNGECAVVGIGLISTHSKTNIYIEDREITYIDYQYHARLAYYLPWIRSTIDTELCDLSTNQM